MAAQQPFFLQLRQLWGQNPAVAVLHARLRPMEVPAEALQYANSMQQSFDFQRQVDQSVNARLGAMGIFGGGGSGFGFGGADPDQMLFLGTMGLVRAHAGDPPATPALRSHASSILRGQVDPMEAFALGSTVPGAGQLIQGLAGLVGDMGPFLRTQAVIMAALAVPREEIPGLLGLPQEVELTVDEDELELLEELEREARAEAEFAEAMESAQAALGSHDFGRAESELAGALEVAGRTSTPDDDIQAIDHMMLLAYKSSISPESLSICVRALDELAGGAERLDDLARITVSLSVLAEGYRRAGDLSPELARIGSSLLDRNISRGQRLPLALSTARALHRMGSTGEAEDLIAKIEPRYADPGDRIEIACLKADLWWDAGDREGATDLLLEVADAAGEADVSKRFDLVQKLVCVWPDDRDGVEAWVDDLAEIAREMEEPQRTVALLTSLLALQRAEKTDEEARLADQVDFERIQEHVPAPLQDMVREIRDSLPHLDA